MTRQQLEHVIRAAAGTVDTRDIVIIGSQAILGSFPDAPPQLTYSLDADVYPRDSPELSIVIDGAIGEMSMFHSTFGYYAHGVDETTAVLPDGWRERLVKVETPRTMGTIGWCLEVHDLAVSKLAAGREKVFTFVGEMISLGFASGKLIGTRLNQTPKVAMPIRKIAIEWLGQFIAN